MCITLTYFNLSATLLLRLQNIGFFRATFKAHCGFVFDCGLKRFVIYLGYVFKKKIPVHLFHVILRCYFSLLVAPLIFVIDLSTSPPTPFIHECIYHRKLKSDKSLTYDSVKVVTLPTRCSSVTKQTLLYRISEWRNIRWLSLYRSPWKPPVAVLLSLKVLLEVCQNESTKIWFSFHKMNPSILWWNVVLICLFHVLMISSWASV